MQLLPVSLKEILWSMCKVTSLCYNLSKVNIIEVIDIPSVLEVLPIVLEIEKETF